MGYWNKGLIYPGGNELSHDLDMRLGNWNMISLNFTPYTPMAYNKKMEGVHLVFIEIDRDVATLDGVYFTDCNAASSGHNREKGVNGLRRVKFDVIHGKPKPWDEEWRKYVQAEILVPERIPIKMFKAIHFVSEASLELGVHYWGEYSSLFKIEPKTFADYRHDGYWVIQFPYIKKVIVTDKKVTRSNYNSHVNINKIKKNSLIWVIVHLYATVGTEVYIIIKDKNKNICSKKIKFPKESNAWWTKFKIPDQCKDIIVLEVWLNNTLWLKRKLVVIS